MEIRTAESFLSYFENIRGRTERVVECIPPDRIEWTHKEGKFTLGDLVRHIASTERYMFAENVQGRPSRYPGHGRELADGYDDVLSFLQTLHAESVEIFARLTEDQLRGKCTPPGGRPMTVWKWLRAMIEHEVHHRGEIYLMLGHLGVEAPPLYGLTSEEVRERSIGQ
jgi:uncharacterized damage-inducible protein DinB